MFRGRCTILTVLFCLQIFTQNVLPSSNLNGSAQDSLTLLSSEIDSTARFIVTDVLLTWNEIVNVSKTILMQELISDLGNFTALFKTITTFSDNVTDGLDCINAHNDTTTSSLNDVGNIIEPLLEIFRNLLSLAAVEFERVIEQYKELDAEFTSNCIEDKINCDGVSNYIVVEVERLVYVLKRIKIDLYVETQVVGFQYIVNWESVRSLIMNELNGRIKNATTCLASKIEDEYMKQIRSALGSSNEVQDPIPDAYNRLRVIAENSFVSSMENVISYMFSLVKQSNNEYLDNLYNIRSAVQRTNQTINLLHNITSEFNVTVSCALPDVQSILRSAEKRALKGYSLLGPEVINSRYEESINNFNYTLQEVSSISLQVEGCNEDTNCDYLAEKIAKKTRDIPWTMRAVGNSTSVLLHQIVTSVRESGVKIVRDTLDELEVEIITLKSCIRLNV